MSFSIRKSVRVGPFRFNFSKSGIGVSAGIKGLRVGTGPRGHYVQMGTNGLSYRVTLPAGAQAQRLEPPANHLPPPPQHTGDHLQVIDPGVVDVMQDSSSQAIIEELNSKAKRPSYWKWAIAADIALLIAPVPDVVFWLGIPVVVYLYIRDRLAKTTVLGFDFDEPSERLYGELVQALSAIFSSKALWHIHAKGGLQDPKYHGGASSSIQRQKPWTGQALPENVKSNIDVPTLRLGEVSLYFLPNQLLVYGKQGFGAVEYSKLKFTRKHQLFIEKEFLPRDAQVVEQTWQYVNKSGGPDKRFKDNPQYPVALYEEIHLSSDSGLNIQLMASKADVSLTLAQALEKMAARRATATVVPPPVPARRSSVPASPPTPAAPTKEEFATFRMDNGQAEKEHTLPPAPVDMRRPAPPVRMESTACRWIPLGQAITVAGMVIPGGFVYFGHPARDSSAYQGEPSLIDPTLPVAPRDINLSEHLLNYWPAYGGGISEDARRGYLQWLRDGRQTPGADIGYVFLFFYGLERRVLTDAVTEPAAKQEVLAIVTEVRRLLGLYGDNGSFHRYASAFVDFVAADFAAERLYLQTPPKPSLPSYELPLPTRMAIGQLAVDKLPLPADWALAWSLADPAISKRRPVARCLDAFAVLFRQKYAEQFGDGFALPVNRTKLRVTYMPASAHMRGCEFKKKLEDLPDLTAVSGPSKKLQALVDTCTELLAPYSRFLAREPDKGDSLEGLLLLPAVLWPASAKQELETLKQRVGDDVLIMSFGELSGLLKSLGALSRAKVVAFAQALEAMQLGMEPDVRTGGKTPVSEDKIALFALTTEGSDARATPAYIAATVTLDLACAVAMADGVASSAELNLLTRHIDSWVHLSPSHQKRLKAHLRLQIDQPPTLASLKKKLEPLAPAAKRSIALLLAQLAQADGVVSPEEVRLLERIYKVLQLDSQLVYSDLHGSTPETSGPTASMGKQATAGANFVLDPQRIEALRRETEQVSALLANVFMDEVAEEIAETTPTEETETGDADNELLGLDREHLALLRLLISRLSWTRAELLDAAADMELMLDGALERINEAALDHLDAQLIDGDDPVEINQEVLERLPV